jgi:hypothetical protein
MPRRRRRILNVAGGAGKAQNHRGCSSMMRARLLTMQMAEVVPCDPVFWERRSRSALRQLLTISVDVGACLRRRLRQDWGRYR